MTFFDMFFVDIVLLFVTAVLAGAINAVAGGGSFLTFPALVFVGIDPITANATNTVVLWPGAVASTGAYRRELASERRIVIVLSIVSLVGGLIGALLLLAFRAYEEAFSALVPWLLLVATLLFGFGGRLTQWVRSHIDLRESSMTALVVASTLHLIISIYGGFFGGGMGVLMLAAFSLIGMENIHVMNALKSLVSVLIKGIAVVAFVVAQAVVWPAALLMIVGAILGGYWGADIARRFPPATIKRVVLWMAIVITILFFYTTYINGA
jgi:hypothetical protein